jgi:hypothetical protein
MLPKTAWGVKLGHRCDVRCTTSASAIPPRFIECRLVNVFGPKMPVSVRRHAGASYRVPPNSFAKMLAMAVWSVAVPGREV